MADLDSTAAVPEVKGCVYLARCTVTGKGYVGKTMKTLADRKQAHWIDAKRKRYQSAFHAAIRKYGRDAFKWSVLVSSDTEEELFKAEAECIRTLNTKWPNGYNLTDGGEGVSGYEYTPEQRAAIGARSRGRPCSEETRRKLSIANKGHYVSPESRARGAAKAAAKRRGRKMGPCSEATKAKISAANKGKVRSPEICKRIGEIQRGRKGPPCSAETKAKISAAQKGKPRPNQPPMSNDAKRAASERMRALRNDPVFVAKMLAARWTDRQRQAMSARLKGKPGTRKGIPNRAKRPPCTEETRARISAANQRRRAKLVQKSLPFREDAA